MNLRASTTEKQASGKLMGSPFPDVKFFAYRADGEVCIAQGAQAVWMSLSQVRQLIRDIGKECECLDAWGGNPR